MDIIDPQTGALLHASGILKELDEDIAAAKAQLSEVTARIDSIYERTCQLEQQAEEMYERHQGLYKPLSEK